MNRTPFYLAAIALHLVALFLVTLPKSQAVPLPDEKKYVEVTLSSEPESAPTGSDSGSSGLANAVAAPGPLVQNTPPAAVIAPEPVPPPPVPEPTPAILPPILPPPPVPAPPVAEPPPTPQPVVIVPEPPPSPPTPEVAPLAPAVVEPAQDNSTTLGTDSSATATIEGDNGAGAGIGSIGEGTGGQAGSGRGNGTRTGARMLNHPFSWPEDAEIDRVAAILRASSNPPMVEGDMAVEVRVRIRINPLGNVVQATLTKTSGYPLFDEAGLDTARHFKFKPGEINGSPVPETRLYIIQYKIVPPRPPPSPFRK